MDRFDKELVTEAILRDAISTRMADEFAVRPGVFWCPALVRPEDPNTDPNWMLVVDADKVPEQYPEAWNRIRHEFEDRFSVAWDDAQA